MFVLLFFLPTKVPKPPQEKKKEKKEEEKEEKKKKKEEEKKKKEKKKKKKKRWRSTPTTRTLKGYSHTFYSLCTVPQPDIQH
ncbi:hypothetical protein M8J77_004517 [Diaphorina citri]|nr:hypothetical protein M8J77_004517 [Diaphorina citri]